MVEKNRNTVLRVQNHCIRTIFRHCFISTVSTCETLLGIPLIDLYNDATDIKFVMKVIKARDMVTGMSIPTQFQFLNSNSSIPIPGDSIPLPGDSIPLPGDSIPIPIPNWQKTNSNYNSWELSARNGNCWVIIGKAIQNYSNLFILDASV